MYMLYLYRRVIFGTITRADLRGMLDLSPREKVVFAPLLVAGAVDGDLPELVPARRSRPRSIIVRAQQRERRRQPTSSGEAGSVVSVAAAWPSQAAGSGCMPTFAFPDISPALPEIVLAVRRDGAADDRRVPRRGLGPAGLVARDRRADRRLSSLSGLLGGERRVGFYGMFVTDAFALFMKALVLIGSAVSIIMALRYNEEHASPASSSRC